MTNASPNRGRSSPRQTHFTLLVAALLWSPASTLVAQGASAPAEPAQPPAEVSAPEELEFSAAGVKKFRKDLARPIKLGVSGGNARDIQPADEPGFIVCSSGTLGGLVLKNGIPHILSNNHVIAIGNAASKGDPIDQPGLIDNDCRDEPSNYVAHLSAYKRLKYGGTRRNRVDAAIAEIVEGAVDPQGRIQGIGIPGDAIMAPEIGLAVKKAGRSTGLTRGTITAIGVSGVVDFGDDDDPKEARFVNQIVVEPNKRTFVESGDSGSIVLFDRKECPYWVGLLFAGTDEGVAAVNPIKRVFRDLKKLKPRGDVTPIGCDSEAVTAAAAREDELTNLAAKKASLADRAKFERSVRRGKEIVQHHDDEILALDGVVGLGVGRLRSDTDEIALHVMVSDTNPKTLAAIPESIGGVPTKVVKTGRFRAF